MEAYNIYSDLRFNGFFQLSQMVRDLEEKLGQQCSKKYMSKLVEWNSNKNACAAIRQVKDGQ